MKTVKILALVLITGLTLASCSNDDDNPDPVNEEEVITTLTATLTGGGSTITMSFQDLDGDGPGVPTINVSGPLSANTTYSGSLDLLNEAESPAESITAEIEEEDEEHQFFFFSTGNIGSFSYSDADSNGNPVGLSFSLITGEAASGNITIILRHEPAKDAEGVSDGDITNAGGETDITVSFPVVVQ